MKKIASLAALLLVGALSFGSYAATPKAAAAQQVSAPTSPEKEAIVKGIIQGVNEANEEFPQTLDEGITLNKIEIDKSSLIMPFVFNRKTFGVLTLQDYADMMGAEMQKELGNDKDFKEMIDLCKQVGYKFYLRFKWHDSKPKEFVDYELK